LLALHVLGHHDGLTSHSTTLLNADCYRLIRIRVQALNCISNSTNMTMEQVGYKLTRSNPHVAVDGQPLGFGRHTFHLETPGAAAWQRLPGELRE
jgi:hypothetical protein